MEKNTKLLLGVAGLLVLILLGMYYAFPSKEVVSPVSVRVGTTTPGMTGSDIRAFDEQGNDISDQITITQEPVRVADSVPKPIPALAVTTKVPASFSATASQLLWDKVASTSEALKKDPRQPLLWSQLGGLRKIGEDYQGAEVAWLYALKLQPNLDTALTNLADLYQNYLSDPVKAEAIWRTALTLEANSYTAYRGLHELYRYKYPAKVGLADDVLLEALAKRPADGNLLVLLARYYAETGDTASARTYYERALTEAKKLKDDGLIKVLEEALAKLP